MNVIKKEKVEQGRYKREFNFFLFFCFKNFKLLFSKNLRLIRRSQELCKGLPYVVDPESNVVNILPHLL